LVCASDLTTLLKKAAGFAAAFFFVASLAGCAACGLSLGNSARADAVLGHAGFTQRRLASADFPVHAWLRVRGDETLTVVIEGDGATWFNPRWPPGDPTPEASQAAALALEISGSVAYVARPCQFELTSACHLEHWTSARFAPELVKALERTLDQLKEFVGAKNLRLVGHSGGGVMAVLLAQGRSDVTGVVTLMAPLAIGEWTKLLDLSSLDGSDPMDQPSLRVPAIHVAGGRDSVVPSEIVKRYTSAKGGEYIEWPQADHACWPIDPARSIVERLP
jgi:pimeloyl-ACP methyl ester carboxylesterase